MSTWLESAHSKPSLSKTSVFFQMAGFLLSLNLNLIIKKKFLNFSYIAINFIFARPGRIANHDSLNWKFVVRTEREVRQCLEASPEQSATKVDF